MAKQKDTALFDAENNEWKVLRKAKDGTESTQDTVPSIEHMATAESIGILQGIVGQAPKKRVACVSLLVEILAFRSQDLSEWKGRGNRKTGQLANELKDEFRKAEDAYFGQFMSKEHALHKTYVGRLPKLNERSEPLVGDDGEENPRARHNYFVGFIRKDPSYSNAKNLVLSYWAFVGQMPEDADTKRIIPPEVMRVMVENAKDVQPQDNSYAAKLTTLIRELLNPENPEKPVTIAPDRLPGLIQDAKMLLGELERLQTNALARANKEVPKAEDKPANVPAEAGDMISRAQDAAKVNMTPADTGKVKPAAEESAPAETQAQ